MIKNNFDQSSTGINLELMCYWDTIVARVWFKEDIREVGDKYVYVRGHDCPLTEDDLDEQHTVVTTGYCQGDIHTVYVLPDILEEDGNEDASSYQEEIGHLFWDSPLYCRLTVDGEEYIVSEDVDDQYEYDKDKLVGAFESAFPADDPRKTRIVEWFTANLPDQPDHL